MNAKTRKKIARWLIILLIIMGMGRALLMYTRARFEAYSCYRTTTPFPSPENIPYDVVFFDRACDGLFIHFVVEEVRLKSKSTPHKQKSVFAYAPSFEPGHEAILPPKIRWISPHDLEIGLGFIDDIQYRLNKVGDINIHYNIKKIQYPGANDAGSTDLWEWLGMGWRVIPNNDNAVYADKPVK